jgi:hypothetical protein
MYTAGRNLFMHLSVTVTRPVFTKFIHAIQLFADNPYIKFYKNPENGLGFDPRTETDRRKDVASTYDVLFCTSWKNVKHMKGKFVPFLARCGPEGSRSFRLPDFHDIRHMKVVTSLASHTGRLYTQECSCYSFSLGTPSSPGPWCGRKEIWHWKIQWHHRRSRDLPTSSAAP